MPTRHKKTKQPTPQESIKQEVMVTISDQYLGKFDEVVERCVRIGFQVHQQLRNIGVIIGLIDPKRIGDLEEMKEITGVEKTQSYQVPPPDSDLQ